jgi:DNA modification methylase
MPTPLLIQAESRAVPLADTSVHCIVTSPPYWGLRDYTVEGQLGLEKLHDCLGWATGQDCGACYICAMRAVARECWRVLRDGGTFWCNIGDSYNAHPGQRKDTDKAGTKQVSNAGSVAIGSRSVAGLKPKDLCGIPWRLALALQADGWTLRSEIIWHKPNPMPESVTDRPTRSHEQVFLFSKGERYFYDATAIQETCAPRAGGNTSLSYSVAGEGAILGRTTLPHAGLAHRDKQGDGTRNARTVWTLATEPTPYAHFATFPTELVRRCILAGTSEHGVCGACKAPWVREVEHQRFLDGHIPVTGSFCKPEDPFRLPANGKGHYRYSTVTTEHGWRPTCACDAPLAHATVFDPFCGSGTTLAVACALGRDSLGTDLSYPYLHGIARLRLAESVAQPSLLYDAPRRALPMPEPTPDAQPALF